MSPAKREPRTFTVADIEAEFQLASYWWGEKWCPAVHRHDRGGFGIRVLKSAMTSGTSRSFTYDYFELDADGTITTAPRGYTRDFKPGRVVDIEAAVERFEAPQAAARRVL